MEVEILEYGGSCTILHVQENRTLGDFAIVKVSQVLSTATLLVVEQATCGEGDDAADKEGFGVHEG